MIRYRSRRRRDAAMYDTGRVGGVRGTSTPCQPPPAGVPSRTGGQRPMTLHSGLLSTLVLLALLLCLGTDVHAAPDPIVEAIQRTLVERGYDPGAIDGAMGWRTRGALREFQRSVGLPATGRTDDATLAALGMKPRTGAEPEPEADTDTPQAAEAPRAEPDTMPSTDGRGATRRARHHAEHRHPPGRGATRRARHHAEHRHAPGRGATRRARHR